MINNFKNEIVKKLTDNNLTISVCESITCGMFASALATVNGVSKVLKGGIVPYTLETKINVLKLDADIAKKHGIISREVTNECAILTRKMFKTDLSIALIGNAGPTTDGNGEVGDLYISVCIYDKVKTYFFKLNNGERNMNRISACAKGFEVLNTILDSIIKEK